MRERFRRGGRSGRDGSAPGSPGDGAGGAGVTGPERLPMDAAAPAREELATATFCLGCFWGPDARFGALEGVVRTRVGYTGGSRPRPTYHDLGGHIESVQVDYDPARVGYGDLLDVFWAAHDPTRRAVDRQYASALFFHDEEQRAVAERSARERWEAPEEELATELAALEAFWTAEAYHQKYHLRQHPDLMEEFRRVYDGRTFVDSTVAARVNATAAGMMSPERLAAEVDRYGLSDEAEHLLRALARQS